jgi:2-polyprenyl-6-methoxyphenol hydroxylase-like FAD-dependent oxidoreductase
MNARTDITLNEYRQGASGHAVVIGGSMAGLLAARVLADFFERVTIIERDQFPFGPVPRKGVPQAQHLHALLPRGRVILEELFPGLSEQLIAAGATVTDMANDVAWRTPAGWGARFRSGVTLIPCSRDLLEWTVRRRVSALPRVSFLEECDVTGLLPSGAGVAGVRIRHRSRAGGEGPIENAIEADLVVDASGRGSHAPQWLEALGYPRPQETVINSFLGYASRVYERPAGSPSDWVGLFVQAAPPDVLRGGLVFPIEGNRWQLTLIGLGKDYPPADDAGFLDFARSLATSELYDAVKGATPISPIRVFRATENRLRHYERLERMPEGFVVLGDGACAFNPVYGQGMSAAAVGALALARCVREQRKRQPGGDLRGLTRRFQRALSKANAAPWMLSTGEDFRVRETVGATQPRITRLIHRYMDRVVSLSTREPGVRMALLKVFSLLEPPSTLFRPWVVLRVLKEAFSRAPSQKTPTPSGNLRRQVDTA